MSSTESSSVASTGAVDAALRSSSADCRSSSFASSSLANRFCSWSRAAQAVAQLGDLVADSADSAAANASSDRRARLAFAGELRFGRGELLLAHRAQLALQRADASRPLGRGRVAARRARRSRCRRAVVSALRSACARSARRPRRARSADISARARWCAAQSPAGRRPARAAARRAPAPPRRGRRAGRRGWRRRRCGCGRSPRHRGCAPRRARAVKRPISPSRLGDALARGVHRERRARARGIAARGERLDAGEQLGAFGRETARSSRACSARRASRPAVEPRAASSSCCRADRRAVAVASSWPPLPSAARAASSSRARAALSCSAACGARDGRRAPASARASSLGRRSAALELVRAAAERSLALAVSAAARCAERQLAARLRVLCGAQLLAQAAVDRLALALGRSRANAVCSSPPARARGQLRDLRRAGAAGLPRRARWTRCRAPRLHAAARAARAGWSARQSPPHRARRAARSARSPRAAAPPACGPRPPLRWPRPGVG